MNDGTELRSTTPPVGAGEARIARAVLSVSDKTGIVEFARGLHELEHVQRPMFRDVVTLGA